MDTDDLYADPQPNLDELDPDLPPFPPDLADPATAAEVLDLLITPEDRRGGGIGVLLCARDDTLLQPIFVGGLPGQEGLLAGIGRLVGITREMPMVASLVLAVVKPWGHVTDTDRAAHQRAIEECCAVGVRLLGTYVVTTAEVIPLPVGPGLAA